LRQRFGTAHGQWHVDTGQLQHGQRIAGCMLERVVAVHGRQSYEVKMAGRI
jgi:hypothetical protein